MSESEITELLQLLTDIRGLLSNVLLFTVVGAICSAAAGAGIMYFNFRNAIRSKQFGAALAFAFFLIPSESEAARDYCTAFSEGTALVSSVAGNSVTGYRITLSVFDPFWGPGTVAFNLFCSGGNWVTSSYDRTGGASYGQAVEWYLDSSGVACLTSTLVAGTYITAGDVATCGGGEPDPPSCDPINSELIGTPCDCGGGVPGTIVEGESGGCPVLQCGNCGAACPELMCVAEEPCELEGVAGTWIIGEDGEGCPICICHTEGEGPESDCLDDDDEDGIPNWRDVDSFPDPVTRPPWAGFNVGDACQCEHRLTEGEEPELIDGEYVEEPGAGEGMCPTLECECDPCKDKGGDADGDGCCDDEDPDPEDEEIDCEDCSDKLWERVAEMRQSIYDALWPGLPIAAEADGGGEGTQPYFIGLSRVDNPFLPEFTFAAQFDIATGQQTGDVASMDLGLSGWWLLLQNKGWIIRDTFKVLIILFALPAFIRNLFG